MIAQSRAAIPSDPRWFSSDGLHLVIDRSASQVLPELSLPADAQAIVSDLVDAVLLDEQDPLLLCVDDWCGTVFDWKPVPETTSGQNLQSLHLHELTDYPRLTVSLSSLQGTPRTIWLAMDGDTLADMPELPESWQSLVRLERHLLPFAVQLQKYRLTSAEQCKIGPGSLLLLPMSYQDQWRVSLYAVDGTATGSNDLDATLDSQERVVRLVPQSSASSNDAREPEHNTVIELAESMMINKLSMQSVWQAGLNMALPLPGELDGLRVVVRQPLTDFQAAASSPSAPLPDLTGSLMKVGEGYGVLLDASRTD